MKTSSSTWWRPIVEHYEQPQLSISCRQIANSVGPYLGIWLLMILSVEVSYLLTLLLAVLAAGFWVRIFIISHDCGHGSFFKSRRANHFWGVITGVLTLMPYLFWRREHARHHGSSGNLDRRGVGDIWTMTVEEYLASSWWRRAQYRIYRNPFLMFGVGAWILFAFRYRVTQGAGNLQEKRSVYWTNFGLAAIAAMMIAWIGVKQYLMIMLPLMAIGSSVGVWLFYVQHQFEGVYWERDEEWDYLKQAMEGSSFYKLPKILQWFTGNIGFHHIHHLSHRIPNYNLERCHKDNEIFRTVNEVTLLSSMKSLAFRLWDENQRKLVGFKAAVESQVNSLCPS